MSGAWWVTKTGKCIRIRDMSDSHLVNTIRFIERKALKCGEAVLAVHRIESMLQGGQIVINRDIQRVESDERRVLGVLAEMREELARRGEDG